MGNGSRSEEANASDAHSKSRVAYSLVRPEVIWKEQVNYIFALVQQSGAVGKCEK